MKRRENETGRQDLPIIIAIVAIMALVVSTFRGLEKLNIGTVWSVLLAIGVTVVAIALVLGAFLFAEKIGKWRLPKYAVIVVEILGALGMLAIALCARSWVDTHLGERTSGKIADILIVSLLPVIIGLLISALSHAAWLLHFRLFESDAPINVVLGIGCLTMLAGIWGFFTLFIMVINGGFVESQKVAGCVILGLLAFAAIIVVPNLILNTFEKIIGKKQGKQDSEDNREQNENHE